MISRHDLVWLTAAGWQRVLATPDCPPELAMWRTRSLPLIGRRHEPGVASDMACLGAPLPPNLDGTRRRAGFTVPHAEIARVTPPLLLSTAITIRSASGSAVLEGWRGALGGLARRVPGLRIYGSLAMQALTGEAHLTATSDIDVLFAPRDAGELAAGLRDLQFFAARLPLDGEILFPSEDAVAWKEWCAAAGPSARVLAKRTDTVRLARRDELLAAFDASPRPELTVVCEELSAC